MSSTVSSPRVLFGGLFHETHTFLPGYTTLQDCAVFDQAAMFKEDDPTSCLGGALNRARALGWDIVTSLDLRTHPGPMVADEVVEFWWSRFQPVLQQELENGIDGIYLVLHGAMTSEGFPDVEGELLERIRKIAGPTCPIGGVTDLHANFTSKMAQNSDGLITYRANPHTDGAESAARGVDVLAAILAGATRPAEGESFTLFGPTNIVWPPTGTATAADPMLSLEKLARQLEAQHPEILALNVHAGFAFADVPECGVSFSAITTGDRAVAQAALDQLTALAWEKRHDGNVMEPTFDSIWPQIQAALQGPGSGPVVISEPAENIGGGAPGDGTGLLRSLLKYNVEGSAVAIWDPAAVKSLSGLSVGQTMQLEIGGFTLKRPGAEPLAVEVELLGLTDGHFQLEDPHSHMASMSGMRFCMGPTALVRIAGQESGILVLLTSVRTAPFDLGQWRSQGVDPAQLRLVGAKAAVAHRQVYDPIARASFAVDTPGPCSSDLKSHPFQKIRRPVFPLDSIAQP